MIGVTTHHCHRGDAVHIHWCDTSSNLAHMNNQTQPTIDLIIPAYNEEENIPDLLEALNSLPLRHVIVTDNGSTDRTAELAAAGGALVVTEPRRGYGAACLAGLSWIDNHPPLPDMVGFLDADLADDPVNLPQLWQPIAANQADLAIACRCPAQAGALTLTQRFGNRLACTLIRLLTGKSYRDLGPMRVIRYTSVRQLNMADLTWGWTVEMQFKAARRNLRTLEINLPYHRRRAGASKISGTIVGSARAGYKIIATILALWLGDPKRPE